MSMSSSFVCPKVTETMPETKLTTASSRETRVDMISNLPDTILHLILSRLPSTDEAIRTSILSTRWRYLWTSVHSLNLDWSSKLKPYAKFSKTKFKKFVYSVLLNKAQNFDSLRLCCLDYYNMSTVRRWIQAASMRKVKSLDLMFCAKAIHDRFERTDRYEVIVLPCCLFTCDSLESLRLFLYRRPLSLPRCNGFPALRVLELNSVHCFDHDFIERLLEICPLLQKLSLIDSLIRTLDAVYITCPKLKTLRVFNWNNLLHGSEGLCGCVTVSCPELVSFEYVGPRGHFIFEKVDSLKKAVILPEDMLQEEISCELGDTCIDAARDLKSSFPAFFPNLKTLELTTTIDAFTLNVLIRIIRCSPNLESLHLIIQKELIKPENWELDEVETWRILTRHLKRVEFLEFNVENQKLDIVRLLLKHGNVLREMVLSWRNKVEYNENSAETMNVVSKFYKAASTVKLTALLKN
ncbi:F-box domain, FBD domain, Leucine-rich repeat domain, L domain-like protein [Artemisia annua]|uniref:F-box domain, FBD domain, Leucine-rich repeat domain, L domain-like protein n=1 Tax=Artemisia annua TaxID=35608 RepID=A0A2U1L498_ARTAN|nr:F-box domain, FBD domain, Leucine-rich repeat domain, L domain-like protein [Artemisia annua]